MSKISEEYLHYNDRGNAFECEIEIAYEMLKCLIELVKFHNKYDVAYSHFGKDTIKCVKKAKSVIEKATGLPIDEVLSDENNL